MREKKKERERGREELKSERMREKKRDDEQERHEIEREMKEGSDRVGERSDIQMS